MQTVDVWGSKSDRHLTAVWWWEKGRLKLRRIAAAAWDGLVLYGLSTMGVTPVDADSRRRLSNTAR